MRLNLDNCFPCSLAWLRKLLKVVDMSEKSEELRADLVIYLNERLDEVADDKSAIEKKKRELANRAVDYKTKAKEHEEQIEKLLRQEETCKKLVSINARDKEKRVICKAELADLRKKIKEERSHMRTYQSQARAAEQSFAKMVQDEKKLREDLELLGRED
jgi:hypothetical protein